MISFEKKNYENSRSLGENYMSCACHVLQEHE